MKGVSDLKRRRRNRQQQHSNRSQEVNRKRFLPPTSSSARRSRFRRTLRNEESYARRVVVIVLVSGVLFYFMIITVQYYRKPRNWWEDHPYAPIGLSCATPRSVIVPKTNNSSPALFEEPSPFRFQSRQPAPRHHDAAQLAYVVAFVEFQLSKVIALMFQKWTLYPPCTSETEQNDADLIFFTENPLSTQAQSRILFFWQQLNQSHCFRDRSPIFLHLDSPAPELSHIEGAANAFYSLFPLLEQNYHSFFLAEPDVAPIQADWVQRLVQQSRSLRCKRGLWQMGSPPMAEGLEILSAQLQDRVDYHMNGNSLYILGCPEFEDYKCRVQTFYVPKGECPRVAGCTTHEPFEGGYDHALYRFRMHQDNYAYARTILHKFRYSPFVINAGDRAYTQEEILAESASTLFVHSKSIFSIEAYLTLKQASLVILGFPPESPVFSTADRKVLDYMYQLLLSGETTVHKVTVALCALQHRKYAPEAGITLCKTVLELRDTIVSENAASTPGIVLAAVVDDPPIRSDILVLQAAGGTLRYSHPLYEGLSSRFVRMMGFESHQSFNEAMDSSTVDALICHDPGSDCEILLGGKLNKPVIVYLTDLGIDEETETRTTLRIWCDNIRKLSGQHDVFVLAGDQYLKGFIDHCGGAKDVEVVPYWGGDFGVETSATDWGSTTREFQWFPSLQDFALVADPAVNRHPFWFSMEEKLRSTEGIISGIKAVDCDNSDMLVELEKYRAVVVLPGATRLSHIRMIYRLNIPIYSPSLALVRSWASDTGNAPFLFEGESKDSFDTLMPTLPFFQYPHIQHFHSVKNLQDLLKETSIAELNMIHWKMAEENRRIRVEAVKGWRGILSRIRSMGVAS